MILKKSIIILLRFVPITMLINSHPAQKYNANVLYQRIPTKHLVEKVIDLKRELPYLPFERN